ncbi:MAG: ABC transporter ATP-binding protein [Tetrasphaera sp.]
MALTTSDLLSPPAPAPTRTPPEAIALAGLTKSFGPVHAVRGIDLSIRQGEVVAFLGPNGAGKTTTIDLILGLAEPTGGSARVFGLEPHEAIRRGLVSAVMQTGGLLKDLTVAETIAYTASLFPHSLRVEDVLRTAGLEAIAARQIGKCSGGEQQRVRFGMALVSDPELIILDEPTTGMDVSTRRAFWENIHADAQRGRTVLFATHYLEEADLYADRVVLVRRGQVVADGTSAEIKALGAGRSVRATWPGASAGDLAALPAVESVDIIGDTVTVHTSDSDAVARHLLTTTPARDLEITARGLEDAFVALTADEPTEES